MLTEERDMGIDEQPEHDSHFKSSAERRTALRNITESNPKLCNVCCNVVTPRYHVASSHQPREIQCGYHHGSTYSPACHPRIQAPRWIVCPSPLVLSQSHLFSTRKQHKVRPGYVPQEDAKLFRGTRQSQMDANALPKGHIIGWVPPSSPLKLLSKSAKKNAKRKEKREEKKANSASDTIVRDNWEDDDEEEQPVVPQTLDSDLTNKGHSSEPVADKSDDISSNAIHRLATDIHKLDLK